ncbi:MAG: 3'-5' exonuclease [Actinomycetes bacterium]
MIAYEWLAEQRDFLVVDTETTVVNNEYHIVQIAIVPVIGGDVADDPHDQYSTFVNPGVPIDAQSQQIHHITDAMVEDAPSFAEIVDTIDAWFARVGAVFVAHNSGFDITRLLEEYKRAGRQMFDVPVLDTMHLPTSLNYPLPAGGHNLDAVAEAFGFTRPASEAHDATSDALLTARTLTGLLEYAAGTRAIVDWVHLHQVAGGVTTASFTVPKKQRPRTHPQISDAHLATHTALETRLTLERAEQWADQVVECATLGCDLLQAKCEAGVPFANVLYPLLEQRRTPIPPGWQLNTFLPGYLILAQHAIRKMAAQSWWKKHRFIRDLPTCDRENLTAVLCPDCRLGEACPPDISHQFLAVTAADMVGQPMPSQQARDILRYVGNRNRLDSWINDGTPELAGYALYLLLTQYEGEGNRTGVSRAKSFAQTLGLDRVEPRLAMAVALDLFATSKLLDLDTLVADIVAKANTDPAYAQVESWYVTVSSPRPHRPAPSQRSEPWNARPRDRVTTTRFKI